MKIPPRAPKLVLSELLKELKRTGRTLDDLPPSILREAQKRGFPDMRAYFLPPPLIRESLKLPLLRDLLVTRSGYCSRAVGHYIPRPEGSLDHILLYCVGGKGWLRIGEQHWDVGADKLVLLPRQTAHYYGADAADPWSTYWIHFTGRQADEFFAVLQADAGRPLLELPCSEEVLSAWRLVETRMAEGISPPHLIAAGTALGRFLGLVQLRRHTREQRERTSEENVQQTIEFMRANLTRPISLRELAHLAHMSVSKYEKAFAECTGHSSINYFNRMKIQKACRLLMETDLPAKTICAEIGYDDPYYFSRLFKKIMGVSPIHFRSSSRQKGGGTARRAEAGKNRP